MMSKPNRLPSAMACRIATPPKAIGVGLRHGVIAFRAGGGPIVQVSRAHGRVGRYRADVPE